MDNSLYVCKYKENISLTHIPSSLFNEMRNPTGSLFAYIHSHTYTCTCIYVGDMFKWITFVYTFERYSGKEVR